MKKFLSIILALAMLLSLVACGAKTETASSGTSTPVQEVWPKKDIPLIIPYGAGGGADLSSRAIAQYWGQNLGIDFEIENRGGANGQTGTQYFLNQYSDDDDAVCFIAEIQFTCSQIMQSATYKVEDFKTIACIEQDPAVLCVNPNSPYDTFEKLNAAVKANPGKFIFGTQSTGAYRLLLLKLIEIYDWDVKVLFYEGNENVTALEGGHIDAGLYGASTIVTNPYGKPLVIGTQERWEFLPDVPTISELANEKLPFMGIMRFFAVKAGWAEKYPERYKKLCDEYKDVFSDPDYKSTSKLSGKDTVQVYMNPEDSQKAWEGVHDLAIEYSEQLSAGV